MFKGFHGASLLIPHDAKTRWSLKVFIFKSVWNFYTDQTCIHPSGWRLSMSQVPDYLRAPEYPNLLEHRGNDAPMGLTHHFPLATNVATFIKFVSG